MNVQGPGGDSQFDEDRPASNNPYLFGLFSLPSKSHSSFACARRIASRAAESPSFEETTVSPMDSDHDIEAS
jgi:hypothetical protein